MRPDIAPGGTFPDYELPDHTSTPRRLSELQGDDPLILTLARGHYCPKEHQQHLELAAFYPKIAVAYTRIATISTDDHHTLQEFRASVGAQWTFLSDPDRTVQKDLDIQEYTDPEKNPMIPHTLVLKPGRVIHSIYNGYWFWGRPSVADLWHDLRAVTREIRPDWDLSAPGLREAWDAGDLSPFHGWNKRAGQKPTMSAKDAGASTAPTQFVETRLEKYAYRRFGGGAAPPLVFLQHFTGTLDNWDPAVTDPLARGREVILFESAGLGRSTGEVPTTIAGMTEHFLAFVDALGLTRIDLLGFSLGGMVAQQAALVRSSLVRRMLLVGTAPEGGEDIMHLEKPELRKILEDPSLSGYQVLVKLFFTPSESSRAAGQAFATRLATRTEDREPLSGPAVAQAQIAAFRAWERVEGERFGKLRRIIHPSLVVNGVRDTMIPVRNSYLLAEHLPNAMLLTYPDGGHGSLFQFPASFVRQATLFLDS